jgi:hypothetical protein
MALLAPLAFAQTATDASSTSPGVPNTGAGGDPVAVFSVLAVSAAAAIIGAVYLMRTGALARR